jgi:cell division protein FtsN
MSRDFKQQRKRPVGKSRGGTLVGMFIGLVLGVCIAAAVVWFLNASPAPFVARPQPPRSEVPADPAQQPSLPGKPGDTPPEKRFQFYDILPGKTDAVPDGKQPAPVAQPPAPPPADAAKKDDAAKDTTKKDDAAKKDDGAKKDEAKAPSESLFLQTGAFTRPEDADNQKAALAMQGLEANVQQIMVQDKTYYRVRLGPYAKVEDMNHVRSDLAKAGINATLSR